MSPSAPTTHERREFATEIKFQLEPAVAERIRAWARQHLVPDPNAQGDTYRVTSLYFDTADFTVFRREGYLRHSKFRIRRYDYRTLFLERKLKVNGLVAKRRTTITNDELARLGQPSAPAWPGRWFEEKTAARRLRPVCQIDYHRTARVLLTPSGPIRLTLDQEIAAIPTSHSQFREPTGAVALTDRVILELKFRRDLPVLFRELAAQFSLNPLSFSKYRAAVQALGLAPAAVVPLASPGAVATASASILACRTS